MKFIITICLFAFAATVAAKIPIVDMADWVCVSEQLNVAADRNPKFAALYSELGQFYQASVTGAEKCNQIDEWVLELFCQCEWKTQVEDLSQMFSDLLREKLSNDEERVEFFKSVNDALNPCLRVVNPRFAGEVQVLSQFFKF